MPTANLTSTLPYKSHPLYSLRLSIINTTIIGGLLNLFAIGSTSSYNAGPYVWTIILLVLSFFFCLHDLVTYAIAKATFATFQQTSNDDKPAWPRIGLLVGDAVFFIVFQWTFWAIIFNIASSYLYGYNGARVIEAYADLANLIASILHAVAFWKELMARQRARWSAKLEKKPCQNCGHVAAPTKINTEAENPSASSLIGSVVKRVRLPKWSKARPGRDDALERDTEAEAGIAASEEDLLATPDESGPYGSQGYGTLDDSVRSLSSTTEKVVKKKGKKRVVNGE